MEEGGTQPEHCKDESFFRIEQPNTWGDICILIGVFGLYIQLFMLKIMGKMIETNFDQKRDMARMIHKIIPKDKEIKRDLKIRVENK